MIPEQLNLSTLAPIGFVGIGAIAVLLGEVMLSRTHSFLGRRVTDEWIGSVLAFTAIAALGLALYASVVTFLSGSALNFNPASPLIRFDRYAAFVTTILAGASLLSCALAIAYLAELRINHGEYYALILLSTAGMMLMVAAVDLLAVFLGLELMSIPVYVLAGFDRTKLRSNESALKYFLIGSFASAILLYGMALLYGSCGSTSFEAIRASFDPESPLALVGAGLLVVGFAFKISSVPFHQWTPDVYEGAPAAVTAFLSVAVKTASVATLLRILALAFPELMPTLAQVFWVLAALSIVVGNAMAVIQTNLKRLLAYSSIAHAGYMLMGITAGTPEGFGAVLFYLAVYVFTNLGAFSVLVALAHSGRDCEDLESLAGLARERPVLAAAMSLFMISLTGIPFTAGFWAKFWIFKASIDAGIIWLTLLAVLMTVVSVYFYLRIPVLMYMRDPPETRTRWRETASGEAVVLIVCAFFVIFVGLFPNDGTLPIIGDLRLLDWARQSASLLFRS